MLLNKLLLRQAPLFNKSVRWIFSVRNQKATRYRGMASKENSDLVTLEKEGKVGTICLNKPKALNALNQEMIRLLYSTLKAWDESEDVELVIIKGNGGKAFCAGGDVRAITEAGKVGDPLTVNFFKEEYTLNFTIGTLKTPYVALLDGITMGGGVGISVHGPFRVTTEKTLFAMPETAIGFFPDVGGSYFLPRLSGSLGMFLALTGYRLKGRDVFHAGIGTHYITSDKIPQLTASLHSLSTYNVDTVKDVINTYHRESEDPSNTHLSFQDQMLIINECFSKDTVEEIVRSLEDNGSDWAKQQVKAGKDFYEGVRAVLVDRDNSPKWDPPTLQGVTDKDVENYFKPLGDNDLKLSGLLYNKL